MKSVLNLLKSPVIQHCVTRVKRSQFKSHPMTQHLCLLVTAFVVFLVISELVEHGLRTDPHGIVKPAKDQVLEEEEQPESVFLKRPTELITDTFTEFILNPDPCQGKNAEDALFLVSSEIRNIDNRNHLRYIYSNFTNTTPYRIKIVFLIGIPKSDKEKAILSNESELNQDIVQGSFVDHYANLTFKTTMGFRWARRYCHDVKLMLKMDDDVFVDVYKFMDYFGVIVPRQTRTINCFVNEQPHALRVGKYRVPMEEYPDKYYPDFCGGFFIVPTMDVLDDLCSVGRLIRFYPLEDVFTYGFVRKALVDVQLLHLGVITYERNQYRRCVLAHRYRCKFLAAQVSPWELMPYRNLSAIFRSQLEMTGSHVSSQRAWRLFRVPDRSQR